MTGRRYAAMANLEMSLGKTVLEQILYGTEILSCLYTVV